MQLRAAQTSLEPQPHRVSRTGRRPFVSQNTLQGRRQPINERARPAQRPRIPDPQAPSDDLNKLPIICVVVVVTWSMRRRADLPVLNAALSILRFSSMLIVVLAGLWGRQESAPIGGRWSRRGPASRAYLFPGCAWLRPPP